MAKLKENPNFKIPTIALTADAVAGAKEKYESLGFADYLAKPFSKAQVQEKLDDIFNVKKGVDFSEVPEYIITDASNGAFDNIKFD